METKDLQLGDLVYLLVPSDGMDRLQGHMFDFSEVAKISNIYKNERFDVTCYKDAQNYSLPILLTKEILELNGFISVVHNPIDGELFYHDGLFVLIEISQCEAFDVRLTDRSLFLRDGINKFFPTYCVFSCSYVHQLQNFLRTAGFSELADNFKVK